MPGFEFRAIPRIVEYGPQPVSLIFERAIAPDDAECEHRTADHEPDDGDHHQHLDQRESGGRRVTHRSRLRSWRDQSAVSQLPMSSPPSTPSGPKEYRSYSRPRVPGYRYW